MKKVLAMLLTLCLLVGLGSAMGASAEEIVTLRWVAVGGGMPPTYDAWKEHINAYMGEKIGVHIDMEVVPWGDWDNRHNVIINTSEPFDILFGNQNVYNTDVMLGAFLDISDMLPLHAPGLLELIPDSYWDACRINGRIYAVPTYKDSSQSEFIVWDKALVEELGFDVSTATTFEAMTPILAAIHEKTGQPSFPQHKNGATYVGFEYDQMSTGLPAIGVRFDDTEGKVVPVFAQPDVMESLVTMHEWYNAGITNADAATVPEEDNYKACSIAQGWAGAAKTTWGPRMGIEAVAYQWKDTIVSNETVRGSLNSISVNCEHPEKALAFLELINTDPYVRDSFYYGLEGNDWDYTDDGRVHRNNYDWNMAGYTQGSFFSVTPTDELDFNQWDEVQALNEKAKPSVLLGFTFDTTAIADQLANCTEIYNRYKGEVLTGTSDPTVSVPQMMEEMQAAGFDDIVAEAQAQVDAFLGK